MVNQKYRHEFKYIISEAEIHIVKNRLNHLTMLDIHSQQSGGYQVRSLYFDDYNNSCYYENENGTDPREKFRIRIYNHSAERIMLECKRKERDKVMKTSCPLTVDQTRLLMRGGILRDIEKHHPLLQKLTIQMMTRRLKPVVIVEYDRIPYVHLNGNVRITLDTNISSSKHIQGFLDETIPKRPILPIGQQLLEVKYDEFLPDHIYQSLQLGNMQRTAFSKYYLCRRYTR